MTIKIEQITPEDGCENIYRTCSFRYLSRGMKDKQAFGIVFALYNHQTLAQDMKFDQIEYQVYDAFEQFAKKELERYEED